MVERDHPELSVRRQCELLGLNRSSLYYEESEETAYNREVMAEIDKQYTETPFYGYRRMTVYLRSQGHNVNEKRVRRLMGLMGIEGIGPKRRTTISSKEHKVYPYLLRGVQIAHTNHVWSTDITYIPMRNGFMYLVAIMDWYSRYIISWRLSNTLESQFCLDCLHESLGRGQPVIFNSDQGVQFTAKAFTSCLEDRGIRISMDGRGRCYDNIFIERLWRTIKQENIYICEYNSVLELEQGLMAYIQFYNHQRPHQSLDNLAPAEVYFSP